MPSANIREVEFTSRRISTQAVTADFTFVVMLYGTTAKNSHEDDVKTFHSIRTKVANAVISFHPNIELIGGKNVGEGAEYTYLGTTLTFNYKKGCL
jgi:hypothetical protein